MLVDLKAPLKAGAKIPMTLRFEKAGEVKVELQVRALGASGHQMQH
jgi:copper(I)-binding protein